MFHGSEISFQAFAVAKTLTILVPYFLLVTAAFALMKGDESGTARSCLVIFTGAFLVGSLLANLWLMMGMAFPYGVERDYLPTLTLGGATFTGPLLRRIVWIMGGLAGHALIYLAWALRQMEPARRNLIATWLLVPAVAIALYSPIPQIRFWKRIYNAESMRAAIEWNDWSRMRTEHMTRKWATGCDTDWRSLLLRANHLYDARRAREAEQMDRRILDLPQDSLPPGLREFILRRLETVQAD